MFLKFCTDAATINSKGESASVGCLAYLKMAVKTLAVGLLSTNTSRDATIVVMVGNVKKIKNLLQRQPLSFNAIVYPLSSLEMK